MGSLEVDSQHRKIFPSAQEAENEIQPANSVHDHGSGRLEATQMGSSTVELSLDPIVLQNQTFTTKKTHHMLCFFNLSFFFFFPNKMFISLSTARLRFVQTPTPSGQHWNRFFQTMFPFRKKEKTEDEKYHTRTTLPRAIFSLFFVFQN